METNVNMTPVLVGESSIAALRGSLSNTKYFAGLAAFMALLQSHKEEAEGTEVLVKVEAGRVFDRVFVAQITDRPQFKIAYFVNKETGTIYGPKSDIAPNLDHWYGTIYGASEWKWGGVRGEPVDPTKFKKLGVYGEYTRWAKRGPGRPAKADEPADAIAGAGAEE